MKKEKVVGEKRQRKLSKNYEIQLTTIRKFIELKNYSEVYKIMEPNYYKK